MEQENLSNANMPKKEGGCLKYGLIGFGIFILLQIIANIGEDSTSSDKTSASDTAEAVDSTEPQAYAQQDVKTWEYTTKTDEMNDSQSRYASLVSDNIVEFEFPYQGGSDLSLTVRYAKKYGTDVYIRISKGQFICNEYEGTNTVRVRFDEGNPMTFTTTEPSDGSSDALFLNNANRFISMAKNAKKIKIEAPFYQEGNRVFTFTVDKPLEW